MQKQELNKLNSSMPKMKNSLILFSLIFAIVMLGSCSAEHQTSSGSLINTAHLDHLYKEVVIGQDTIGAIWIYCEAPDYQHVGDEDEGFTCVDDVARALIFYSRFTADHPSPEMHRKITMLTRFLLYMYAENGYFYNFMFEDGRINTTHINSEAKPAWWTWRAMWGLTEMYKLEATVLDSLKLRVKPVMDTVVQRMTMFCPPPIDTVVIDELILPKCFTESMGADQAGDMLHGLINYHSLFQDTVTTQLITHLSTLITQMQFGTKDQAPYGAIMSWQNIWHAWGNGQAAALIKAGQHFDQPAWSAAGIGEVKNFHPFLLQNEMWNEFKIHPAEEGYKISDQKPFPQIAYGLEPMIMAALEAYKVTGDTVYARTAGELGCWFFGKNKAGLSMYDPATGRGYDGLTSEKEINRNAGAESTIESLLAIQALEKVEPAKRIISEYLSQIENE